MNSGFDNAAINLNASELLKSYIDEIRIPESNDRIYKDECVYSFDNPVCFQPRVSRIIMII